MHHVVNYIREHHAHWVDFVSKFGRDVREEVILFISGTTMMTSKWAVAAFHGQYKQNQGTVIQAADLSSYATLDLSPFYSVDDLVNYTLQEDEPFPEDVASAIQWVRPAVDVDANGVSSERDGMGIPVGVSSVVLDLRKARISDGTPVEDNQDVVEDTKASKDHLRETHSPTRLATGRRQGKQARSKKAATTDRVQAG
ncbi:hypothetical protein C8Q74DRAFT_1441364 [Fomes fomentarius]|nr:hypothetical protein C8Q74DRAFT_1441364 [Fomes fomentarius]